MLMSADSSKHLGAFDSEQTKSVEAIRLHSPNSVDLELAKDIGLISTETREKIEESLPDHNVLFQSNLLSQRGSSEESFRRAFESVYGKFLFESNTKVPDKIKQILEKILKSFKKTNIEKPSNTVIEEIVTALNNKADALDVIMDEKNTPGAKKWRTLSRDFNKLKKKAKQTKKRATEETIAAGRCPTLWLCAF